jgi:hypothetical protein
MRTKAIYFGVLAMLIMVGFAAISIDSGQIKALSDTQLLRLRGGAILCKANCRDKYCTCETNDCEDMECSPCKNSSANAYCKGNDEDQADVTACWKTTSESDSCTKGTSVLTNCQIDAYSSTDTSCSGTPIDEDKDFYGNDCT